MFSKVAENTLVWYLYKYPLFVSQSKCEFFSHSYDSGVNCKSADSATGRERQLRRRAQQKYLEGSGSRSRRVMPKM